MKSVRCARSTDASKTTQKQAELAVCKALVIQHRSRRCCPRLVARTQGLQHPRVVGCGGSKPAFRLIGIQEIGRKRRVGPVHRRRLARGAPPGPSARPRGEPSTRKGCPLGIGAAWAKPETRARSAANILNRSEQRCEPGRTSEAWTSTTASSCAS